MSSVLIPVVVVGCSLVDCYGLTGFECDDLVAVGAAVVGLDEGLAVGLSVR